MPRSPRWRSSPSRSSGRLHPPATLPFNASCASGSSADGWNTDGTLIRVCGPACTTIRNAIASTSQITAARNLMAPAPNIGRRLDGFANRDLDFGALLASSSTLGSIASLVQMDEAQLATTLRSWGPGKYDAGFVLDGISRPTLIPPVFGLAGVAFGGYTGFGPPAYFAPFFAVTQMRMNGTFFDPRLDDASKFPAAARSNVGHTIAIEDAVSPKLAALDEYVRSLVPAKPAVEIDGQAAARGKSIFETKGKCARCHVPPLFTEPGFNLHYAAEVGIDDEQARRSPSGRYRTTPLRGISSHEKGGFYHDGRFPTLRSVVDHYDTLMNLDLSDAEKSDLALYVRSL